MTIQIEGRITASLDLFINGLANSQAIQAGAALGLNEHIRLQEKNAVNFIAAFTRQPKGIVGGATRSVKAAPGPVMSAKVVTEYPAIPAGQHTGRSWDRSAPGATHGDWKGQMLPRTFTVARWGGAIYERTGSSRKPIRKMWGPVLGNELAKENRPNLGRMEAFMSRDALNRIMKQVGKSLMR